ncbi:PACE efflux transporter [Kingella negevensis]|uniref:PACE efflux transporter n=1 Tax=Kingella negevensis TaxID=1522312 RepID=UPI000A3F681C|nr:PACE efflux transporter [Kingella negevensis]MDK4689523.1 PACE efflux transporter [Kingella negevensis]WII92172.1 PACE efflux transporter [Kingella negevensis]
MISLLALLWNVVFNWLFDQKFSAPRETRTFAIRALHAVLFEGGLLLATVPLIMWWLDLGFVQALAMDIGMTLFVMVYTVVFHWCYDNLRVKFKTL